MRQDDILALLRAHRAELGQQFDVDRIALVDPGARGKLRAGSDVGVLVAFRGPATLDTYLGLSDRLETLLGRPVDLVAEGGHTPHPLPDQDLIPVD
ncbi:MAG: DNA polymerase subunit beta [Chromatiales bacterium]|jgi:predicted nucleotidyltransferase